MRSVFLVIMVVLHLLLPGVAGARARDLSVFLLDRQRPFVG